MKDNLLKLYLVFSSLNSQMMLTYLKFKEIKKICLVSSIHHFPEILENSIFSRHSNYNPNILNLAFNKILFYIMSWQPFSV